MYSNYHLNSLLKKAFMYISNKKVKYLNKLGKES